jgi:hypothetical protein
LRVLGWGSVAGSLSGIMEGLTGGWVGGQGWWVEGRKTETAYPSFMHCICCPPCSTWHTQPPVLQGYLLALLPPPAPTPTLTTSYPDPPPSPQA